MSLSARQIAPPKNWPEFEDLCRALFASVWGDPYTQKNGRSGQPQHGVDIWGRADGAHPGIHCVQCKGKDAVYGAAVTIAEFDAELAKAEAFEPSPSYWILATSGPVDGSLQRHARLVSEERIARGVFPVTVLGWDALVALIAEHPIVIDQFYPAHGSRFAELQSRLDALPDLDDLKAILVDSRKDAAAAPLSGNWQVIQFSQSRGLGPALLGRALGAGDVGVCPKLPEADELARQLVACYSARLAGEPGAGKSVCALQCGEAIAQQGYRVVRLIDPRAERIDLLDDDIPTVHLVDDAHLARSGAIESAEHSAGPGRLLVSSFTVIPGTAMAPGTVHLDARRAVKIIAEDFRERRTEIEAAVRAIDDQIGEWPGEESIDWRIDSAAESELPWQFCFILSGGWRRVRSMVASARAAGADLVLAAAALRQLASRDAMATYEDLAPLLAAGGVSEVEARRGLDWLVAQRILLSANDLRCPHQRFAARVFDPILSDRDKEGRLRIRDMLGHCLSDRSMPLTGLNHLLSEWRMSGSKYSWAHFVRPEMLGPYIERCWAAVTPADIGAAATGIAGLEVYIPDYLKGWSQRQVSTVAGWFSNPASGTTYAVGGLINGTYRNKRLGRAISRASNPEALADALEAADAEFASDIANMVTRSCGAMTADWKQRFLVRVDRSRLVSLISEWPAETHLWRAAEVCQAFAYLDQEYGLDLIEAMIPAIAPRMRADPLAAVRSLDDVFWHCLKVIDHFGVYRGKNAPTPRMKALGTELCSVWEAGDLATALSISTPRQFQDAALLLHILYKANLTLYQATVAAIDWAKIEATVEGSWRRLPHDFDRFVGLCHSSRSGRTAVAELIGRHADEMGALDGYFAYLAPETAISRLDSGQQIALANDKHVDWNIAGPLLAEIHKRRPDLVTKLLEPHTGAMSASLTEPALHGYCEALPFLRGCRQIAPPIFEAILASLDVKAAADNWPLAFTGRNRDREVGARHVVAWILQLSRDRPDGLGDLSRQLIATYPRESSVATAKLGLYKDLPAV